MVTFSLPVPELAALLGGNEAGVPEDVRGNKSGPCAIVIDPAGNILFSAYKYGMWSLPNTGAGTGEHHPHIFCDLDHEGIKKALGAETSVAEQAKYNGDESLLSVIESLPKEKEFDPLKDDETEAKNDQKQWAGVIRSWLPSGRKK